MAIEPDHVVVLVVRAPGLKPGMTFRFAAQVANGMELVEDASHPAERLEAALARWAA